MPIIASKSSDEKTFQPAPEGTHQAVCVDVIDKGILETTWQGKTKQQHKIDVAWQISENRDDGKPFLVFKRYTLSLGEKANLRKDLESWRGRKFTRDEELGFDVEKLIGANCLVNILHNVNGEKTYANVVNVAPLLKGMKLMQPRDYVRVQDRPTDAANGNGHHDEPRHDDPDEQIPYADDPPF